MRHPQPVSAPTGTVTFLFTDIEGSTKLWEADAAAMRSALMRHDELLQKAIAAHGGTIFKTVGDAFCAAFNTAQEAVEAALGAQLALFQEPWQVNPPVRARMAVHTGSAQERDGDYYGPPVNRVARLLSAGHGGQTLISLVTQELIRDALPPFASLRDLGDASLKDLARPERVYQLQHDELPSEFPPLSVLNSPELPNNLPQQPTSFIGRERELADVKALLSETRLLTLVGPGGAGKTRLALQAAADLLDEEGDGVWLVELAPLADPCLVAGALAQVLGVKEAAGQMIRKTLAEALKAKTLLIVLDNCEHLINACAELASDLLRSCPNVRLLATSREPLGVPGEQVYRIPTLSVPTGAAGASSSNEWGYTADTLSQYDSVRLFVERAKAAQPSFGVTDQNAPAVAQVCYHLDGIPLAIELAAARVRSLPVEQVNARLDSRFRLLTGGARTLLPRQQTLRALIDWSYDLLADQEKAMLGAVSVFAGGWTLDAAEAVCTGGETGVEDLDALDLLTSLTDKSLVVYEELPGESGAARYGMLESIRQYASDRLEESGGVGVGAAKNRHRDWCLAVAEQAAASLLGPEALAWFTRVEAEHDNMRAALAWCEQRAHIGEADRGLRLAVALANFWRTRGYNAEGRRWIETFLRQAKDARPVNESDEWSALRAKGLNAAASLAYSQGDYAAALGFGAESLQIARLLNDKQRIANVLNNMGNIAYAKHDFPAAAAYYQESLELRRDIGYLYGIAASLGNLGLVKGNQGDLISARPLLQESLDIMRRIGDAQGVAVSLNNLAELDEQEGNYSSARVLYQESLDFARQVGDKRRIANALHNVGKAIFDRHDPEAAALFRESLALRAEIGEQSGLADLLDRLAEAASARRQYERALRLWSAADTLRDQVETTLSDDDVEQRDAKISESRTALGSAADAAAASGRAMSWKQAVQYALSDAP